MPSVEHELLIQLFRDRPELVAILLRALGVDIPAHAEARTDSAELTDVAPTEYRADLAVRLVDGEPVLGVVLEVQLSTDSRKPFSWPVYQTTLRARLRCDVVVLVVAPDPAVANWARKPIRIGPGHVMQPLVAGSESIPFVDDLETAIGCPELAVLSVMAHGQDADAIRAANVALNALRACGDLDADRGHLYTDVIRGALGDAARTALEKLMDLSQYRPRSDWGKEWFAKGQAAGEGKGTAKGIVEVLDARGIAVTSEQRDWILSCTDPELLRTWLRRAAVASSGDEVFG